MSEQAALFGVSIPPGLRLGPNQHYVLKLLQERPRSSVELGQAIHTRRHSQPEHSCRFCESEGASVGASLRNHGLVRFSRKLDVWYLVEQGKPKRLSGAQSDDIGF